MNPDRLALLADRLDLQQLVTDYAYAIDERAFERLDRVFTPDAYIDYRAAGGIDGLYPVIRAWLPQALKPFPAFMHLIGNLSFEVEGDRACGKLACLNPMVVPRPGGGGEDMMILGLWYLDEYQRTTAGWRICRRVERKGPAWNVSDAMRRLAGS